MTIFDIVILIIAIVSVILGIKNGFIRQLSGLLSLILGVYLAFRFSSLLSPHIAEWIKTSETFINIISFSLIFLAVVFLIYLVGRGVEKIVKITMMGWLNMLLGAIFSLFKTILILSILLFLVEGVNELFEFIPKDIEETSIFYKPISTFASKIFPYLRSFLGI